MAHPHTGDAAADRTPTSRLHTAQVHTRSTSDLLTVEMISRNRSMSTAARMAAISKIVQDWDRATLGSVGRGIAQREAEARRAARTLYEPR